MPKILIVEGNVKEMREMTVEMGSLTQSNLYENVLHSLADDLICTIVFPADQDAQLPSSAELAEFDGIVWTGSALNIYDGGSAIDRQIDFMKRCLGEESRIFGSCWGLQVATIAAGGEVTENPKGREIGIARDIRITDVGLSHPLYRGKQRIFDAVTVHVDHIAQLPTGSRVLSSNSVSQVQALEIKQGRSVFWGVQYHPEFDLKYIAGIIRKYRSAIVDEGICEKETDVDKWATDFEVMQGDESKSELISNYRLGSDVLDPASRLLELSNWLSYLTEAKCSQLSA